MGRGREQEMIAGAVEAEASAAARHLHERRRAYDEGQISAAELVCIYVAEAVQRAAGHRWRQARRRPELPCVSASPWVRLFAERQLCRIPSAVHRALVGWADRRWPVDLLFHIPTPQAVLERQARGGRIVSLLDSTRPIAPGAPPPDGLAFAIHDLCHLEKFMDPAHHVEQVGFFALIQRALADPRYIELAAELDDTWDRNLQHVIADMNGSAAFLFLALKSQLKLAACRRVARLVRGGGGAGSPDQDERTACEAAHETLFALLGFEGDVLVAARSLASKRDGAAAAARLVSHFTEIGASTLAGG